MKISINLLPPEIITEQTKNTKFYKIQYFGVFIILVLIFLTSLTLALQILQSRNIVTAQAKVSESQQKVESLKNTQVALFVLKNRVSVISQYLGVPSKQSSTYRLIDKLIPPTSVINGISVDKSGTVVLSALLSDTESLDVLLGNLTDKEKNENQFDEVSLDSLNRSKNGVYRISLKIKPK